MRRWLMLAGVAGMLVGNSGCFINIYSSDPNRRVQELLNTSEDLRQIEYEWERIWFTDQPSHLTPERIHGGIQSPPRTPGCEDSTRGFILPPLPGFQGGQRCFEPLGGGRVKPRVESSQPGGR